MKSTHDYPTLLEHERQMFRGGNSEAIQRIVPNLGVQSYRRVLEGLTGTDRETFEELMFHYSLGKVTSDSFDCGDLREALYSDWRARASELHSDALEARLLRKRTLGFLERASAKEVFLWTESVLPKICSILSSEVD